MLKPDATTPLTAATKQPAPRDGRLYAAVPYRAHRDKRLSLNDCRVLIAACGYARRGTQILQPVQSAIAAQLGCTDALVYRYIQRLVKFGYLVQLAKPAKKFALASLYGVIFDPDNPPVKSNTEVTENDQKEDIQDNQSHTNQSVKRGGVTHSALIVAWRKLAGEYQANELELRYWQELSAIGCTPDHLAAIYAPLKPLIGFHMAALRDMLRGG